MDEEDFSPAINRLSTDLNSLKDGTISCRSTIQELQAVHDSLEKKIAQIDASLTERRAQVSDLDHELSDGKMRLNDLYRRQKDVIGQANSVQGTIDRQNAAIDQLKQQSLAQLDSNDRQVAALADQFVDYATLGGGGVDGASGDDVTAESERVSARVHDVQQQLATLADRLSSLQSQQLLDSRVKAAALTQSQQCIDQLLRTLHSVDTNNNSSGSDNNNSAISNNNNNNSWNNNNISGASSNNNNNSSSSSGGDDKSGNS